MWDFAKFRQFFSDGFCRVVYAFSANWSPTSVGDQFAENASSVAHYYMKSINNISVGFYKNSSKYVLSIYLHR